MKRKIKLEVLPNHYRNTCWACKGKTKIDRKKCTFCDGTGIFIDTGYYHIITDKNGKKYCFDGDSIK